MRASLIEEHEVALRELHDRGLAAMKTSQESVDNECSFAWEHITTSGLRDQTTDEERTDTRLAGQYEIGYIVARGLHLKSLKMLVGEAIFVPDENATFQLEGSWGKEVGQELSFVIEAESAVLEGNGLDRIFLPPRNIVQSLSCFVNCGGGRAVEGIHVRWRRC
jgi:hypothetical protein